MTTCVSYEISGSIAIISFDRPPVNFFNAELIRDICDASDTVIQDFGARAIVLRSEGRHFCAGADFTEDSLRDERVATTRAIYHQALRLFSIPIPIVAAVQGAAVGGGLGLACAADFRVAEHSSRFHANFSTLGFHPGFGLSVTLPSIVGQQRALELLYASPRIDGKEAKRLGLVDRLAPDKGVRLEAVKFAEEIAKQAPLAVQSIKHTMRAELQSQVEVILEREHAEQARLWQTRDCTEGIKAARERRDAEFIGC